MADANGANYTKYAAPTPSTFMGAEWGGKLRATHDTYTFASAVATFAVNVGVLKPGEVFIDGFIHGADLGSATTLQLGDAGDDDRYLAATVFTTANQVTACRKAEGLGYKNDTAVDIPLFVTVGVETANGAIEVVIFKLAAN
jgi:hypothetical protein